MMRSEHGIHALHRAIVDGRTGGAPQQVEPDGTVSTTVNDVPVGRMNNFWLRTMFRDQPATVTQHDRPASPLQRLTSAFDNLKRSVAYVTDAIADIEAITDDDGNALVDAEGMDEALADELRGKLDEARDSLSAYKRAWGRRHPRPTAAEPTDDDEDDA
jgi:hypothetical protein